MERQADRVQARDNVEEAKRDVREASTREVLAQEQLEDASRAYSDAKSKYDEYKQQFVEDVRARIA